MQTALPAPLQPTAASTADVPPGAVQGRITTALSAGHFLARQPIGRAAERATPVPDEKELAGMNYEAAKVAVTRARTAVQRFGQLQSRADAQGLAAAQAELARAQAALQQAEARWLSHFTPDEQRAFARSPMHPRQ